MSPEPIGWRSRAAARCALVAFITAGAVLSGLTPAQTEPSTVTNIKYYTVEATTAQSLNEQMITRGPLHGPGRAYANIVAKPDYSGQLVQGSSCRVDDFLIKAEFVMTLPRLGAGTKLSQDVAARWESFQSFVRRHEEGHRTIWIETMEKAQTRISALRAPSCQALQARIDMAFQEEWSAGERRQDAYDRADQQKLASHPLLVAARSAQRKVGAALAPPPQAPTASMFHRVGGRAM